MSASSSPSTAATRRPTSRSSAATASCSRSRAGRSARRTTSGSTAASTCSSSCSPRRARDAARALGRRRPCCCSRASTSPTRSRRLQEAVEARGWAARTIVGNDTFAVLRAGTERGWGVAVVCGAGINCVGVAPDGRHARFPALGAITGDWGGGYDVGLAALGGRRAQRGRARPDDERSSAPCRRTSGSTTPHELARGDPRRAHLRAARSIELAPVVLRRGRPTTRSPRRSSTGSRAEVVALARAALDAARPDRRARRGPARRRPAAGRRRAPAARRSRPGCASSGPRLAVDAAVSPPIVGAALLGLDELGAGPEAQARLRRELGEAVERLETREEAEPMADVRFEQATRIYPGTDDAGGRTRSTCTSQDGEFMVLVGPSGSGKTTALRMLAGPRGGRRRRDLDRRPRRHRPPAEGPRRRDGLPELRALPVPDRRRQHRLPAARSRRCTKAEREQRVARGRGAARADRVPRSASRRSSPAASASASRWAARSSARPSVFLMDEPLSNLDAKLRVQMRADIAALQARARRDDRVRHARPVRGDDARPPRRRAARTAACSSATRRARCTTGRRTRSSPASSARRR